MPSKCAVELVDVKKDYLMGKITVSALRGVNLKISSGGFVSIVGPSGSGKTTLLNIIGLLDRPTEGRVYIDGMDASKISEKERAKVRLRYIGFTFQMFHLIPWLTALQNVEIPLILAGIPSELRTRRAIECLKAVGLANRINHRPGELSGGEQQRVAIARAIANNPKIILADEPTGNLDSKTGMNIVELLRSLNEKMKTTVVIVTHNLEVANSTNRIFHLRDGIIIKEEEP